MVSDPPIIGVRVKQEEPGKSPEEEQLDRKKEHRESVTSPKPHREKTLSHC